MNLYLVQHGEARPKEEDPERSLSDKGMADVTKIAKYAATQCNMQVDKICHSGKLRAAQTAGILAEHLGISSLVKVDGIRPLDVPDTWVAKLKEKSEDLLIVGHLPHLARLATSLLCGAGENVLVRFQTGGILALKREDLQWQVQWMVVPEIIPG